MTEITATDVSKHARDSVRRASGLVLTPYVEKCVGCAEVSLWETTVETGHLTTLAPQNRDLNYPEARTALIPRCRIGSGQPAEGISFMTATRFDRTTVDPKQMNGQPCIRGMRLTVRRVLEAISLHPDREELFPEYPNSGKTTFDKRRILSLGVLDW